MKNLNYTGTCEIKLRKKEEESVGFSVHDFGCIGTIREKKVILVLVNPIVLRQMYEMLPAEVKTPGDKPPKVVTQFFRYVFLKDTEWGETWEVEDPLMDLFPVGQPS